LKGKMMAIIFGKIKCAFCDRKTGFMCSVHGYGMYALDVTKRTFYHPECLELIQMYPEAFGHRKADLALDILQRMKENKKRTNKSIIPDYQKKLETLRESHFENMMPSKR
jgi:hypothetical protein